jgi:hypothetical protein
MQGIFQRWVEKAIICASERLGAPSMTKRCFTTIVLVLLLYPVFASAQEAASNVSSRVEQRYDLVDVSGHRSPVHIAGSVTFSDNSSKVTRYSYQVDASAVNVSKKSVLLLCLRFQTSGGSAPGLDDVYQNEYFLGEGTLAPGALESVHLLPSRFSAPKVNGLPSVEPSTLSPTATAQVEFVQFTDGSIWGDRDAAAEVLRVRWATVRQLATLEHTYVQSGEQAFQGELSKETLLPCINSLRDACKDKLDYSGCELDRVQRMLEAARKHRAEMRSGEPSQTAQLR